MYDRVWREWNASNAIHTRAVPLVTSLHRAGFGTPGTQLHGVQFRESILSTREILHRAVTTSRTPLVVNPDVGTVELMETLLDKGVVKNKAIGSAFIEMYKKAMYGPVEVWTEREYLACMKIVSVILNEYVFMDGGCP